MMLKNYFNLKLALDKKYVLGFSGGPDSTFLFFHLIKNINPDNLVVAHVNYNLRDSSARAEQYVKDWCQKYGIKYYIKDVKKTNAGNVENWARETRYNFFNEILKKEHCDAVLIAHNLNDNVETYLLQKARENLVSYFGLNENSRRDNMVIIRPMLEIRKSAILQWLALNDIKYDVDETNEDTSYLRNKIRKELNENSFNAWLKEQTSKNRMMGWVYKKITPMLQPEFKLDQFMPLNDKEELVFIFEYLKTFVPDWDQKKVKKQITCEIAKELRSPKSYIKIDVSKQLALIKDRNTVFLVSHNHFPITKSITSKTELKSISYFKNFAEISQLFNRHQKIYVSNDFRAYQSKLRYRGQKLNKIFQNKKTSYKWKIENAIIYSGNNLDILNNSL